VIDYGRSMRTISALAASAALAAAGCGAVTTAKERFGGEAGRTCAAANERVAALGGEPRILTARHAEWVLRVTAINRRAIAALRALEPPEAGRRVIDSMLTAFERGFAKGEEIARASRAGNRGAFEAAIVEALNEITAGQLAAAGYGLDDCTRLGRVG
jgi:hypothetical protein